MADGVDYPETDPKPKRKRKKKKRNPENKKLSCPDCDRKFYFNCQLNFHRLVHTGEKPYVCDICDKAFNTPYSLKNHKYIHTDEKPFQCSFCKYACRDSSTLRKHQAKHMGVETTYECKLCSKSYKHKYLLKAHVAEAHLNVDLRKIPCKKCGKLFKTNSQLNTHVKLVHNRANEGHCPVCNIYIPMMYNLSAHLSTHVDARPYRCTAADCTSAYKDKNSLCKHMRKHNLDEQFPCDICGRLFPARHKLNHHIVSVHGKRKRVQCDYCGVRFYSKAYLVNHIQKKHSLKRARFECDRCGLVTHNKPSIVMHLKHAHRNEDDRTCKICHTVYKKHIYLKHHYKFTHKIAYKTKTRPALVIKEEPPDDAASVHSIDLFEVDKTEPPDAESNPDTSEAQPPEMQTVIEFERLSSIPRSVFDQFYVQHVKRGGGEHGHNRKKSTESQSKINVDKKALEYVKKSKVKMLAEARRKEAARALERARQVYNERMKRLVEKNAAAELNKKPIKVKLFKKNQTKCSNVDEKSTNKISLFSDVDEKVDRCDKKMPITDDDDTKSQHNNNVNEHEKADDKLKEDLNMDVQSDDVNNKTDDQKSGVVDESSNRNDDDVTEDDKVDDDDENESADEEWNCKKKQKNRKVNFNSHQCYICFKLYESKEKLLDHCKDHFDVCNDKFLKKCPLCPYVTKNAISRHLRLTHGVRVKVPYGRLQDKLHNTDGCRYYFELDDPLVHKMEVIPSIKNLNKMASMNIDKKRREDKDKTLAKTKLVRKGKEWIVETEKIDIGEDVMMPELDSDVVKNLDKIGDSDGYFDGLKKLYHIAKKSGKTMLFPCQSCDKICRNLAALKLHNRKHEANPKPFKKKVWKHKLKDTKTKTTAPKKPVRSVSKTDNRNAKPKPIKNKHKCDPQLKQFYENNIRGGNIEFWQFLKIFNKMGRDNITDFKDLESRHEYGIVIPDGNKNEELEQEDNNQKSDNVSVVNESTSSLNPPVNKRLPRQIRSDKRKKCENNKIYKRVVGISKKTLNERNLAKQKLREKNVKVQRITPNNILNIKERNLAKQRLRDDIFLRSQIVVSNSNSVADDVTKLQSL